MIPSMEDYIPVVGEKVISDIYKKGSKLYGKHVIHLNSTFQGGGVAEMLSRLVPMMNFSGIDAGWRILHGNPAFFEVTKKFHNALQSGNIHMSQMKKKLYQCKN